MPLQLTGFIEFNHREGRTNKRATGRFDRPVVISPYVSYFQLEWTLPNYLHPDKNQYWTWLEGLEKEWNFLGNTPYIRFNGLAPGDYILHIRGADSRGNPAATELAIPLRVRRIYYQRWWFFALCATVAGGMAIGTVRYRYRQKLEMEKVRTRIAGDLHDEVGSMLTGLAMQAELLEMQGPAAGKSTLNYIKEVSRNAVSKMRDMTWSIDSGRDRVVDLVDRMREFANEVLTPVDIVYTIETYGLRPSQELPVELRRHLYLIFKEAIANICKHSCATRVEIVLANIDRGFEMRIRDNGSGFTAEGTFTGLGLESMRRRAKMLGGICSVENADGCLVKVRLGRRV
jgi:two-component sensor histidine kinase